MYCDVCEFGISYDNYWDMQPVELSEIIKSVCDKKSKENVEEINSKLALAWYSASLQGVAVNDPKKFPKKPISYKTDDEKKKDTLSFALKLEAMMRSNIVKK